MVMMMEVSNKITFKKKNSNRFVSNEKLVKIVGNWVPDKIFKISVKDLIENNIDEIKIELVC